MNERLRLLAKQPVLRYVFVGGISYLLELAVLYGLIAIGGAEKILAVGVAFWVGLIVSFVLQKIVAFQDKRKQPKRLATQATGYIILVLVNYSFTLIFVHFLTLLHVDLFIARTIALAITTLWNYFIYKKFLFRAGS